MLKHLRSSVLWFALLAQFVHAQRSGSTFSILSESTGSLFAEGNTTTTSFSQIGGSEALQGTFSTTTTNVSGTIGFLGRASAVFTNPASTFTVSGGQGTSPYYNFTDGNGQTPDFGTLLLNRGTTYEFSASGVSTSHPFMVGESYGDMNSSLVSGGPLTGTGGKITLTIPSDFNGSLYYFCTNHSGMVHEFKVRRPNHLADLNASVAMEMIWVQPGTFMMGQDWVPGPEHNVTLTKGFYLGKYEVTQAQYEAVMTGNSDGLSATPSNWPNNADRPVEKVSWEDIQKFLTRLNAQESGNIPAGWSYVLPTEAQWEYACRAGTTTVYSWGDNISASDANWNHGNDANQTENVGQYAANPWGFFDMHGNVWEWTADWYGGYSSGAQTDPEGSASGSVRVIRGGSWPSAGTYLRSAFRNGSNPSNRTGNFGFRVGFQEQSADVASPEMSILGDANITQLQGVAWVDPGVEAHDVRDGNLTSSVSVSGTVDVNTKGTYTLTYTVSDSAGNEASITRTVNVGIPANYTTDLNSTVALEMIWVDPGTFMMGSPSTEVGRQTNETEHNVTLTQGFYLGKYEVTQAQYEAVMTGNTDGLNATPSDWANSPDLPVQQVSWDDIQVFLTRLNDQQANELPNGWAYVLPTEAQWEYACRAGTATAYSSGDTIAMSDATFIHTNVGFTTDVGEHSANPWGFFDMHGNVYEWTADWYGLYSSGAQIDPEGPATGSLRVYRGGSASDYGANLRSAYRDVDLPGDRNSYRGFRVGFQYINKSPTDLNSTTTLTIAENQPVGIIVGEFNATDPEGGAITYHFVNGENNNSLFTLETNGTLKTAGILDYEGGVNLSISVQARDEQNGTINRTFTVGVTDELEWGQPKYIIDSLFGMELLWVEPGQILDINITEGFYLGKYEVTQQEYIQVTGTNPGWDEGNSELGDNLPVEWISKVSALSFCSELNDLNENILKLKGAYEFTLPSAKEWEYACRAGTTTNFFWGDETEILNWNGEGTNPDPTVFIQNLNVGLITRDYGDVGLFKAANVGSYSSNAWGFYDMHGNVPEWTSDGNLKGGGYGSNYQVAVASAVFSADQNTKEDDSTYSPNGPVGFGFRVAIKPKNSPPSDLNSTATLTIAENQPIGTIVGEFNAADANEGTITYHLLSGENNNSLFTLEANGTLKTAITFDYETNASSYTITVEAKDELNATTQGDFTVILLDQDEGEAPSIGDGTTENPYQIATLANLKWITYNPSSWSSHFLQTADINASDARNWDDGKGFKPIGFDYDNSFKGVYDGSHHLITDLFINRPDQYVGLFGYIQGGQGQVVSKVNLRNIHLTGLDTGSIVGQAFGGLAVEYCSSVDANLTGTNVGGLVGNVNMGGGSIKLSCFKGYIDGKGNVGGIAGSLGDTAIDSCYAITQFFNGGTNKGGLAGSIFYGAAFFDGVSQNLSVSNLPLYGSYEFADSEEEPVKLTSFWDSNMSNTNPILESWAVGKTTQEMKIKSTFLDAGWDFNDTWFMPPHGYPILRWQVSKLPPTDLNFTTALTIPENQPLGAIVGRFEATTLSIVKPILSYDFATGLDAIATDGVSGSTVSVVGVTDLGRELGNGNPSPAYEARGWLGEFNAGRYFKFEVTNLGSFDLNISSIQFDAIRTAPGTGPTNYAIRSSIDSFSNNLKSGELSTSWNQIDSPLTNHFLSPSESVEFRIIGWGANNIPPQGGHFILDNIKVNGSFRNQPLTYHFVNGDNNNSLFTLETNGTLKTATIFDYETNASTYIITVQAKDELNATTEGNFTVTLEDIFEDLDGDGTEDHLDDDMDGDGFSNATEVAYGSDPRDANSVANTPPSDLNSTLPLAIAENQPIGTIVGEFNATDLEGGEITYTFVSGENNNSLFTILSNGSLKTAFVFDYESNSPTYSVTVQAKDELNATIEESFTVILIDLDDEIPVITLTGDANISHEAGAEYNDFGSSWSDNVDGSGVVIGTGEVDVSTPGVYVLNFDYTDAAGNVALTVTRTVNVEDTTVPLITLNGDANITHEAGSVYHDSNATWSDIVDGTGVVVGTGEIDTYTPGIYVLSYNYFDTVGNAAATITRNVLIANSAPVTLINRATLGVEENKPVGTRVGDFQASDPNGHNLFFSLTTGPVDNNNSLFSITSAGELKTTGLLDYERDGPIFTIWVQVRDEFNASVEGNFTVNLLDVYEDLDGDEIEDHLDPDMDGDGYTNEEEVAYPSNPRDSNSVANFTPANLDFLAPLMVSENKKPGMPVGKLTDGDGSSGEGGFSYSLIEGEGGTHNEWFVLEPTGLLRAAQSFDYESGVSRYLIRVGANTPEGELVEQVFSVHLLDDPYENNPYAAEQGTGASVAGESNSSDYQQYGMIDPVAGWTDSNQSEHYAGNLGSSDVNMTIDDGLRIYAALSFVENEPVGTLIGQLQAYDRDEWAVLTYSFTNGFGDQDNAWFKLDENGTLRTTRRFDFETEPSEYTVRARVSDERNTFTEEVFSIYLLDEFEDLDADGIEDHLDDDIDGDGYTNDEETDYGSDPRDPASLANRAPADLNVSSLLAVFENQPVGTWVGEVISTDPDGDLISYHLIGGGNNNSFFTLDQNGTLKTATVFDYELNASNYIIVVEARDEKNASVVEEFTIELLDLDDTKPQIVLLGQAELFHPYRTTFKDPGVYAFDLVDGNLTDQIMVSGLVKSNVLGVYELVYRVVDESGNDADPVTRTVVVDDSIFDRTPKYLTSLDWLGVEENKPVGTFVGEFNATDPDEGEMIYSLAVGGVDNAKFELSESGALRTKEVFDFEKISEYTIRVRGTVSTGQFVEENFSVFVWDQVAPIVDTKPVEELEDGVIRISGEILDDIIVGSLETGFYISLDQPFYDPSEDGVFRLLRPIDSSMFNFDFFPGEDVRKVYVMAFASSEEGENLGLLEEFENVNRGEFDNRKLGDVWTGALRVEGSPGWWDSWWFGTYFKGDAGWWYHIDLGWIYPSGGQGNGLWLWKEGLNWVWTRQSVYPYLYSHDLGSWYYFYGELNQKRMLFDYGSQSWKYLDDSGVDESRGDEVE